MTNSMQQARSIAAAGMDALRRGDGARAEQAFDQAITAGWPGGDIWIALSQARRLQGKVTERQAALQKALDIEPTNIRAKLYLAEMHAEAGEQDHAHGLYEAAQSGRARSPATQEMQALWASADRFMTQYQGAPSPAMDYRIKFEDLNLGNHPDDELFEQSLAIASGASKHYVSAPTKYLFPGLPARQFYPRDMFDWSKALESKTQVIQAELSALLAARTDGFAPYVEGNGREGAGVTHTLVDNPDWSAFYLLKQGERQEDNIAACPETWAAIEAIGGVVNPQPAPSVLFSLLKPGARIPPHNGMLNTRLICHLPLVMPEGCGFRVGNDTRDWKIGEMFAFDDTIEHEAWNNSDQARYILIFEIWHPSLSARQIELLTRFYSLQRKGS